MQVTIKHCLPWGSFNVQTFNLDLNVDVNFLQDLISAKFNISNKDQILKYRRDGLTFKLIPGWSLVHYGLTDKAVIYLEKRQGPNEQQAHNQELMNIKMKQDYFVRLGIVKKEDEEESMEHYRMSSLLSCDGSLLDQAINSKNTGRLTYDGHYAGKRDTVSLQRLAVSVVGEDNSIESLIKEVKANNLGKVMKTLIGVSDKTMSLTKFPEKEETIEVKAKRIINQKGINGWSAFHWAVFLGHIDLVAEFLNLGADINSQTDDGWTPLQLSIYKDHMEGTKLLLNQPGININAVTSRGAALHVASNTGRLQLISLLLENGADINVKTKEGQTPYEMATKEKIKNLFKANLLRTRAETRASEAPKPVLVKGWLYKKKKRFPTFKKKFFALNPIQGTLIGYKTEESYPNKPIYIIALNEVTVIRKKNPEILFDKRLTYMKIETKNENYILGCFNKDTIEKWMDHLEKAHEYTSMHDERFKQAMLHKSSTYSVMNSVMTAESGLEEVVINDFKNKSPMKEPATQRDSEERKKQHDIRTPELSSKNASLVAKEKITLSSFKILKEIGSGSFGKVYKAKKKDTGKIYALKVLEKWSLIMKNQIHCAVAEANILKKIKHPFIVTLHYTFQTSDHLFLVMDYCPGGDLNTHLCNRGVFNEQEARLIIAELLLAVEHLHSMDVLYRDLKPENILVDGDGHIQLTDFGLSKEGVNNGDVAKSFCGSPAYLAPEMLSSKGVSRMADIYGIGTVLYELLVGKPPYYSNDINQLYKKIQKGSITLPHDLSKEAKCFITKLLDRNPGKRIGAYDKAEIRRDPFFNGINWEQVAQRRLPPINPSLCKESQNHSMFTKMKPLLCEYDHASDEELENHIKGFSFIREN